MKNNRQKHNWIIDAILFIGFLLAFFLDLTCLTWHQWLGVFLAVLTGYHLLVHWKWVLAVTQRFFGRTSNQARLYYLIDGALLGGFGLILVTGLVISTWLSFSFNSFAVWVDLHVWISILTLLLTVIKLGLHWRWIVSTAQRLIAPLQTPPPRLSWEPQRVTTQVSRREFISLMGVVSLASLVAIGSALNDPQAALAEEQVSTPTDNDEFTGRPSRRVSPGQDRSSEFSATTSTSTDTGASSSSSSSNSSSCVAQCNRNCSYPGHCRRYVDTNNNNRCDLSECA